MELMEGVVVDNNDPRKLKRVRIRIHNVHDPSIPNAELPWALPVTLAIYGYDGSSAPIGVPTVGTSLLVVVNPDDISNPIYLGAVCHSGVLTADEQTNYPNRIGFVVGSSKFFLDRGGAMRVEHAGSSVVIDSAGSIAVQAASDVKITSSGTVTVSAAQIMLN